MKIAIASIGKSINSEISPVAGRSPYYLIFENKNLIEIIKNPFIVGGGAGWGVASMLGKENVELVIAGKFGGNIETALEEEGIKILIKHGIVENIIQELNKN